MQIHEIHDCALAFYDGGWRASDAEMLREHFPEADPEDMRRVIECLEDIEEARQ